MRSPLLFLALALAVVRSAPAAEPPPSTPPTPSTVHSLPSTADRPQSTELNLRALGAIGDGQPHPVSEWIAAKKYKNLRDLQRDYPFVTSLDWSADEAAFQRALHELPPEGGTIRIPAGRYIATAYGWRIDRDHVRLVGAGARDTMLSTGPKLVEGLVLAPYRHVGWRHGVAHEYPFAPDSGIAGADKLRLREPSRVADLRPGDLVFIRNGACRFDQDYGEFNEIAGTTPEGDLILKHPLARDYTLASLNWANETAEPLTLPKPGKTVTTRVRTGEGFFALPPNGAITVGEALLEIVGRAKDSVTLRMPVLRAPNGGAGFTPAKESLAEMAGVKPAPPPEPSRTAASPTLGFNPPPDTILPAGTKFAKSRAVIRLTRTTRDFSAQGLRVFGRRKALNLSNSYESTFLDCDFVRRPDATTPPGGLTIDGDGGRFATFMRCSIRGTGAAPMQFARSFGNVTFEHCTFVATNVVFSEFCFGATLRDSDLQVPATLGSAVIVGRSGGDYRVEGNRIVVTGGALRIFDAVTDIASQKFDAVGPLTIRDNRITAPANPRPRMFLLRSDRPAAVSGNTLNGEPVAPPP